MTESLVPPPSDAADALWRYFAGPPQIPETDDLLELADRFVELKRHLGHKYETVALRIGRFLRFMGKRGIRRAGELSPAAMREWADSCRHLAPTSFAAELETACVLLDHLKTIGKLKDNPGEFLKHRVPRNSVPHIFSPEELSRIFIPSQTGRFALDHVLIYRFIYACGLRAQEAAHLLIREFDPKAPTVLIRRSKFGKDRLLPVDPRLACRLAKHLAERRSGAGPEAAVFLGGRRRAYVPSTLSRYFKQHLLRLGLYRPDREGDGLRYMSPRLHSLRHSMAVHRLLKWYREGADVQAKLPLLSTYLGHSAIQYTQVYLKITAVLLREADQRFSARWEREFPLAP